LLVMGVTGLAIILLLNAFDNQHMEQLAAVPFQTAWYSTWLPSYILWFVFPSIGLSRRGNC
jgi:hypothetical protein